MTSPTIQAIWWPKHGHTELEVAGTQYSIFYSDIERTADSSFREQRAQTIANRHFYRFYLKIDPELQEELIRKLQDRSIELLPDNCSGSVSHVINQYTDYSIGIIDSRYPLLLARKLFKIADKVEFVGQKRFEQPPEEFEKFRYLYGEFAPLFFCAGAALIAAVYCLTHEQRV